MDNNERLSLAYTDLKDKHIALRIKHAITMRDLKLLNRKYLELCKRYSETNNFLNGVLKEKWYVRGLTEDEQAFMLKK